jgi:predicted  nucleic acid-binding Zn-ribbon protein
MTEAQALLALQEIDIEELRAERRLEELPEKRAILEVRHKQREIEELQGKADMLVNKLNAELKAHQDEISTLTEKIAGEQKKLDETSDHRQVQALTREMDGLRRRRDKIEMESLTLMERIEKAAGQVAKVHEALAQLATKEQAIIAKFQERGAEVQAEIATLKAKRDAAARHISASTLERYEQIRQSKGGVAVGRLTGDTCSACRMSLPAERVAALCAGPDIGTCTECRRLLVVREEAE